MHSSIAKIVPIYNFTNQHRKNCKSKIYSFKIPFIVKFVEKITSYCNTHRHYYCKNCRENQPFNAIAQRTKSGHIMSFAFFISNFFDKCYFFTIEFSCRLNLFLYQEENPLQYFHRLQEIFRAFETFLRFPYRQNIA